MVAARNRYVWECCWQPVRVGMLVGAAVCGSNQAGHQLVVENDTFPPPLRTPDMAQWNRRTSGSQLQRVRVAWVGNVPRCG